MAKAKLKPGEFVSASDLASGVTLTQDQYADLTASQIPNKAVPLPAGTSLSNIGTAKISDLKKSGFSFVDAGTGIAVPLGTQYTDQTAADLMAKGINLVTPNGLVINSSSIAISNTAEPAPVAAPKKKSAILYVGIGIAALVIILMVIPHKAKTQ